MSLFQGLELGKRALMTHQLSLNTAGHNIANVNTPGYTRQRVITTPSAALESAYGPLGIGVDVSQIEHVRNQFLTNRWREENQNLGRWETKSTTLSQIESFFNEPQDSSLGAILNDFWAAWQDLSNKPEAPETRQAVIQQAELVTNAFHQVHSQLSQLQQSLDSDIKHRVDEINNLGREIADLNRQIAFIEVEGEPANDLRDKRDYLIDQLSQYVDVNTSYDDGGRMRVSIGAMGFVEGPDYWPLEDTVVAMENGTKTSIEWRNTDISIDFFNGEMKALFELRDEDVQGHIDQLNELSEAVVEHVNSTHRNGYGLDGTSTGVNFFDQFLTNADQITLNIEVVNDVNLIAAASGPDKPGDGSNALSVANVLKFERLMSNGSATIDEYYNTIVGSLGIQVKEANDQTENYTLLVQQLENSRQSVQGVSLDEEMTNMMKFQHAYDAAARVITFMDEALSTVISGMGITR